VNVNAIMGALGMGIVRLVRSTIGKTGLVLIAGKQEMKAARNNCMKKVVFSIILFMCPFIYGFAEFPSISAVGYLNYGISQESGNNCHTISQDIVFLADDGLHIPTLGIKINPGENTTFFIIGYRYSLAFFSLGGIFLFGPNIGVSPEVQFIIPLVIINFKLFLNYNIYLTKNDNPSNSLGIGFMISLIDLKID
jgi:hypothetical protein